MEKMDMEISNRMCIPNDIIVEILSWLPAKSVLRMRWASKYLFDLTSSPGLHELHLHRSTTSDHDFSVLSSASFFKSNGGIGIYNFQCYLNYKTGSLSPCRNVACPVEPCNRSVNLVTCINGLMFYRIKRELGSFCIWNPCTKEYRVVSVPDPPMFIKLNDRRAKKRCLGQYGFGYDHTTNDYKVVRHDYYYDDGHNCLAFDVQIYTLVTDSWRSIGPVPYQQPKPPRLEVGVFVNGALHWLLDPSGAKIVSFDIGKEEYKQVFVKQFQPKNSDDIWERTMELQVFERSLCCLVQLHNDDGKREMWMMKDYDVNNNEYSGIKLFRTSAADHHCCTLLRSTQDGEILMLTQHGDLVVYDPQTDTRRLVNTIYDDEKCYHVVNGVYTESEKCYHVVNAVYTESLVSLNSGTYRRHAAYLKNKMRKNEQR